MISAATVIPSQRSFLVMVFLVMTPMGRGVRILAMGSARPLHIGAYNRGHEPTDQIACRRRADPPDRLRQPGARRHPGLGKAGVHAATGRAGHPARTVIIALRRR